MSVALQVRNLTVSFDREHVIDDLSLTLEAGESLAVIGPTGSGKSVLFRTLIGALPFQGDVRWAPGTTMGYVPQKLDIERDVPITAMDLLLAQRNVRRAAAAEVRRALELVELEDAMLGQPIGALSGGQFQRLLLGFALIGHPTVLLLDEPTAGIDEPGEERLHERIDRLRRERRLALLVISHELSFVYRHADRVLCLGRRAHALGRPADVLTPARLEELYGAPMRSHGHR
jgi:zinc transport system ATP-binding protein